IVPSGGRVSEPSLLIPLSCRPVSAGLLPSNAAATRPSTWAIPSRCRSRLPAASPLALRRWMLAIITAAMDTPSPSVTTTIDVFSDVVCPWCYLGKRRLSRALAQLTDRPLVVTWRAFRLDPSIPPEGIDRQAYIERKFGSAPRIEGTHQRLTELGRMEGIDY